MCVCAIERDERKKNELERNLFSFSLALHSRIEFIGPDRSFDKEPLLLPLLSCPGSNRCILDDRTELLLPHRAGAAPQRSGQAPAAGERTTEQTPSPIDLDHLSDRLLRRHHLRLLPRSPSTARPSPRGSPSSQSCSPSLPPRLTWFVRLLGGRKTGGEKKERLCVPLSPTHLDLPPRSPREKNHTQNRTRPSTSTRPEPTARGGGESGTPRSRPRQGSTSSRWDGLARCGPRRRSGGACCPPLPLLPPRPFDGLLFLSRPSRTSAR